MCSFIIEVVIISWLCSRVYLYMRSIQYNTAPTNWAGPSRGQIDVWIFLIVDKSTWNHITMYKQMIISIK